MSSMKNHQTDHSMDLFIMVKTSPNNDRSLANSSEPFVQVGSLEQKASLKGTPTLESATNQIKSN